MKQGEKILIGGLSLLLGFFLYKKLRRMISSKGIRFLIDAEGFKTQAYKDVKGLWTIGVGHLIDLQKEAYLLTKKLTKSEVETIFDKDLDRFENAVKEAIKVPLQQYEKDALVNLAFNIGAPAFKGSTLVKKINARAPKEQIRKEFAKWRIPDKIIPRRAKEVRLYFTGNYSPSISQEEIKQYMG